MVRTMYTDNGSRNSFKGTVGVVWFRACKYVTATFFTLGLVTGGAITVVIVLGLFYQAAQWNVDTNPVDIYESKMTTTSYKSDVSNVRSNQCTYFNSSESQYCLYKFNTRYHWNNALTQCQALDMQLPVIETVEEFYNLKTFVYPKEKTENHSNNHSRLFWIGGKTEGEYDKTVWDYEKDEKGRHRKAGFVNHVCVNIEISGIQLQHLDIQQYKGIYVIQPKLDWCDDMHPTYKHIVDDLYIYWIIEGFYWKVGTKTCSDFGFIASETTDSTHPFTHGTIWSTWSGSKSQWTTNENINIKCVYMSSGGRATGSIEYCIQLRKNGYFLSLCNETAHVLCERNSSIYMSR